MRFLVLLLCFGFVSPVLAKEFSVATVDLQKLFKQYPETKKAEDRLAAMAELKKKDLADSAQELQDLQKELDGSGSILSAKTKARKETEFKDKAQKYQTLKDQIQTELAMKENEMSQQILKEIKDLAAAEAKQRGIDLVLDTEKTVYVRDGVDLTDDILKSFGKTDADSKSDSSPKKK